MISNNSYPYLDASSLKLKFISIFHLHTQKYFQLRSLKKLISPDKTIKKHSKLANERN